MILIEKVCYQYANGNKVLDNLSFTIKKGEFTAVIGQNGAGKTTLLKHFNGLLKPSAGRVLIDDMDTRNTKTSILAKHIGFLFQNPDHQIFCPTVYEEIAFGLRNMDISKDNIQDKVMEAAGKVGIASFLQNNPFSLSKGQRQRVALASVLAMGTETLVLDEPTTGQDYQEGLEIMEMVRELHQQGKTVVIVTHDMELVAKYAKRVIILYKGKVLEDGPTDEVLCKSESLKIANLFPPQIYLLARRFHKLGLFKNAFTVEEMYREIMRYVEGENHACNG